MSSNDQKRIDSKLDEFIKFQINRKVINLYKTFFIILEDLQEQGFLKMSSASYSRVRKKVLDGGNDCIREIEDYLEKLDVSITDDYNVDE